MNSLLRTILNEKGTETNVQNASIVCSAQIMDFPLRQEEEWCFGSSATMQKKFTEPKILLVNASPLSYCTQYGDALPLMHWEHEMGRIICGDTW